MGQKGALPSNLSPVGEGSWVLEVAFKTVVLRVWSPDQQPQRPYLEGPGGSERIRAEPLWGLSPHRLRQHPLPSLRIALWGGATDAHSLKQGKHPRLEVVGHHLLPTPSLPGHNVRRGHTGTCTLSKPAWAAYSLLERFWCPGSVSPGALKADMTAFPRRDLVSKPSQLLTLE